MSLGTQRQFAPDSPLGRDLSPLSWRNLFRELDWASRPLLLVFYAYVFGVIATYRNFGFDLADGGVRDLYPYVADGWGIWFWFAHIGLTFNQFFFILNLVFAGQVFLVAFPRARIRSNLWICIIAALYLDLWFLFGQTRYGMALALLAPVAAESVAVLLLVGAVAVLLHKAVAGGIALLLLWRSLCAKKYGLIIAIILSAGLSFIVRVVAQKVLVLVGYEDYLNWADLPSANTPLKYYYLILVLFLWKIRSGKVADRLLILSFLFLPFSYFNVFAGRSFQMFSVIFLYCLIKTETPRYIRFFVLIPYIVDLAALLLVSGFYF